MPALQSSLFPEDPLRAELAASIEHWLAARRESGGKVLRDRSAQSYRRLWATVTDFLADRRIAFGGITTADLRELLESRQPRGQDIRASLRYGWTVLWLIREVAQAAGEGAAASASAAQALLGQEPYRYANSNATTIPDYLEPRAARDLIAYLQASPRDWKDCRDKTAVALMLGAGLRPGEVRTLQLAEIVSSAATGPWKLSLEPRSVTVAHETPMARWASRLLRRWLEVRAVLQPPGRFVFVSTAKGTEWSEPNLIRRCGDLLEDAGIDSRRDQGGLFLLRHTFALRQLARGRSDGEVAGWLGIKDIGRIARYRSVILAPVEIA